MDEWSPKRLILVVEGFKQEKAGYLYGVFRSFFSHLGIIVHHINLENLALSLLSSEKREGGPSEIECRDAFLYIISALIPEEEHFVFVCDSLTEPYERRERYFRSEYSTETNCIFVLEESKIADIRDTLGVCEEEFSREIVAYFSRSLQETNSTASMFSLSTCYIKEKAVAQKKKYIERLCILLSSLKKRAMLYKKVKISQGVYLCSRYSTLYLLHSGYTVFFMYNTGIILLITKILSKITAKKKWCIYLSTYHRITSEEKKSRGKDSARSMKNELRFKKELGSFCEKERICRILYPGGEIGKETLSQITTIPKIEASSLLLSQENKVRDTLESLLLVEGLDRTLILASVSVVKMLICHIKRASIDETSKQLIPLHTVVKLSIKGPEVVEKRYYITRGSK